MFFWFVSVGLDALLLSILTYICIYGGSLNGGLEGPMQAHIGTLFGIVHILDIVKNSNHMEIRIDQTSVYSISEYVYLETNGFSINMIKFCMGWFTYEHRWTKFLGLAWLARLEMGSNSKSCVPDYTKYWVLDVVLVISFVLTIQHIPSLISSLTLREVVKMGYVSFPLSIQCIESDTYGNIC